ncbi:MULTISPECIES: GNAT family N-acetyltransferase [Actinosynnema]|uniref:GNAT family N-acetyltransferase n=1 Tax=Actinosynnema TaxID=40566 RepID=UPI003385A125|nr:Acetyltransferase (GNAT) domain-containing protein [Actinosynnema pretiosum]
MLIRVAAPEDFPALRAIEARGGEAFRAVGMPEIADDEPMSVDVLASLRAWVLVDPEPVAWVAVAVVDGGAHVEQVCTTPERAGERLGAALLDHVAGWARGEGLAAVTLTTFRDVPWNAPYYRRLGFAEVAEPGPGLRELVAREAAHGLDPATRVVMARAV